MTDPIRDELHRLNKEFGELLGISMGIHVLEKTTSEQLVQRYGLTTDEAKSWVEQEPDYQPSDEFLQLEKERRNRRGLDRTVIQKSYMLLGPLCCVAGAM